MGLFQLVRKDSNPLLSAVERTNTSIFPKGSEDIEAGTEEVLHILNYGVSREDASRIIRETAAISRTDDRFDQNKLCSHLYRNTARHYTEEQVSQLYRYLIALHVAILNNQRTPAEITRMGQGYFW